MNTMTNMIEKAKSAAFKAILTTHADEAVTRDGDFVYTDGGGIPLDAVVRSVLLAIRVPDDAMLGVITDYQWQAAIDSILKEGT